MSLNGSDRYGQQKTRYKHVDRCLEPRYRQREKIRLHISVFHARHKLPGIVAMQGGTTERDRCNNDCTKTNGWSRVLTTYQRRDQDSHRKK